MNKKLFLMLMVAYSISMNAQHKISWVATTPAESWKIEEGLKEVKIPDKADVEVLVNNPAQTIKGFGTCFNELGWTSLSALPAGKRESIMRELFAPGVGANFTLCRMPVGANDFSRNWYSYDETDGDFGMNKFSIANDFETLIPFIKNALKYNPSLQLWASPWSPPSWMKYNSHYAAKSILGNAGVRSESKDFTGINNGLQPDKEGKEGTDMFIQEDKYYKAYALYFAKFIQAYKQQNIRISMVMPQNEFNSTQIFPSCTWTAKGLARFISYLGPQMQNLGVNVFFGTMERPNALLVDTILNDPGSSKYVKGVGFQWAGKKAIPVIHQKYPGLTLYQTEQECGDGKNDWKYCVYCWGLMKHYLTSGANAYMYWNTTLKEGGISTWGWKQNSLVSVDTANKTYKYNYEYYLIKHLSHYVKPGAKRLNTSGSFDNLLAFSNPDKSIIIVLYNESENDRPVLVKVNDFAIRASLKPNSFNTLWIRR